MASKVKELIDYIIEQRAKNDPTLISLTKAKMIMKGIQPDKYNENSEDDPALIEKLKAIAEELNLKV